MIAGYDAVMDRKAQSIKAILAPGRRRPIMIGAITLLAILGLGAAMGFESGGGQPGYRLAAVERGRLVSFVAASGALGAVTTVEVGSQISGQVQSLAADFNDRVTANQEIARIAPETFQARLEEAAAAMAIARASVVMRQAGIIQADAALKSARARLNMVRAQEAESRASLTNIKREHERQLALFQRKIISSARVDDARMAYDQSRARLRAAPIRHRRPNLRREGRTGRFEHGQGGIGHGPGPGPQRQAAVNQAEVALAHTYIRSPVSGTVIARNIDMGQTVAASLQAPVLFIIAEDLSRMQVEVAVDEADIGAIQTGQAVKFSVDSYPRRKFGGEVRQVRLAPETVQNVVTYTVVVSVNNADRLLLPGMTANVEIAVQQRDDVLKVPNRALRYTPAGAGGAKPGDRKRDPGRSERIIKSLTEQLSLDEKQQTELRGFFEAARETLKGMYMSGAGREELREAFTKVGQQVGQSIPTILKPGQLEIYRRIVAARNANPVRPGRVWLLDEDGRPRAVDLRIGASDGDFSEIVKGELSETDQVIIAEEKAAASCRGFFGLRF
ncbi:MAG: efflux RND transporter periplasmic adaptor subunit [Alphaproteobacteria bacterium]